MDLVIFDCDGVLADSEVLSARVLVAELKKYGLEIDTAYVFRHFVGSSFPKVADRIRVSFKLDLPPDFEDGYRSSLVHAFADDLVTTAGLHEMLEQLDCARCVATSSSPPRVQRTLELCDLKRFFVPHVFTASQVARGKPAPDLFLFAAGEMGVDPADCLVIEDSLPGIEAARAADMEVWRYTGGSHLTGLEEADMRTPDGVPCFDNWRAFYQMAPGLKLQQEA